MRKLWNNENACMAIINPWLHTPSRWSLQQCFEACSPPIVAAGLRRGEILPTCLQLIEELCFILWLSILQVHIEYRPEDFNRIKVRGLRRPLKKRYSWENSPDSMILFLTVYYEIWHKPNEWRISSPVPLRSFWLIARSIGPAVEKFCASFLFLSFYPVLQRLYNSSQFDWFFALDTLNVVDGTFRLIPKLLAAMLFAHFTSLYIFPLFLLACSWGARAISTSDWAAQHISNTEKPFKDVNETPIRRTFCDKLWNPAHSIMIAWPR